MGNVMSDNKNKPLFLKVDWEVYAEALANSEMNEQEKKEFIEMIWSIVVSFVDMGFDVHPVQQVYEQSKIDNEPLIDTEAFLNKNTIKNKFNVTANFKNTEFERTNTCLPNLKK